MDLMSKAERQRAMTANFARRYVAENKVVEYQDEVEGVKGLDNNRKEEEV